MVAIESDWQVDEMCKQFESEKRQCISQSNTLHGPKTELVTDLGDAIAEVDDLCVLVNDAVSDNSNPSLVDEDFLQLYNNDLEGKLKEIKRQKEDPDERCEGDTDVEDIFPLTINLLDTRSTPIARRKGKETAIQHDNPPSPLVVVDSFRANFSQI
ncbi:Os01g0330950 [Oryza sativa Japonica Group]|uniref:Os01g0330950 protein n=1 Tax=Oryza sativa subsp. japonica TaxID=39947 RepID=A0A0P0V291_ORYSJ|nr:Os01g0330950 [Oryza sativa Japonica Group]